MSNKAGVDFFFSPASVAVVGASDIPGKISNIIVENLKTSGFKGAVYPVNPKYSSVLGLRCYPSLSDIEGIVDIAFLAIPSAGVPEALKKAAGKAKGAIVISGGFGESGASGKELEKEVKEIAKETGIRVIGPNCMGIYDAITKLDTFFIPKERVGRPGPGGVSIISQSGSFAVTAMDELAAEGVGVARIVSYGNRADVNESDCLDFLANDVATKAVVVYIESVDGGRRFVEAASRCSSRKPVFAVKVGKYGEGARAAMSHTGAMTGRYEVYRAAFRKAGVVELGGYEEFVDVCKAFGSERRATGRRIVIITDGGGIGVGIADACHAAGLTVPPLSDDTAEKLKAVFPPYFAISNPIDLTGSATDEMYAEALEKTADSGAFDIAIVAALWGPPGLTDELPGLIAEKAVFSGRPVIVCSPGGAYTRSRFDLFRKNGLPVFTTPESAVRAASALAKEALLRPKTAAKG